MVGGAQEVTTDPKQIRFVGHRDTPLGQRVFGIAEAETEAMVQTAWLMISGGKR